MTEYLDGRVAVKYGDITEEKADAIVNAANSSLLGGGGVDGAIHRAGGPDILAECRQVRNTTYPDGLPTGQAVATTAGRLHAKHVIHTVGPVWHGGKNDEERLLGECYLNSLVQAKKKGCKTIAFPAISTGVYGFPKPLAAKVSSQAVKSFIENDTTIEKVLFVFFGEEDAFTFNQNNAF